MSALNPDRIPAAEVALASVPVDHLETIRDVLRSLFEFDEEGITFAFDTIIERRGREARR